MDDGEALLFELIVALRELFFRFGEFEDAHAGVVEKKGACEVTRVDFIVDNGEGVIGEVLLQVVSYLFAGLVIQRHIRPIKYEKK